MAFHAKYNQLSPEEGRSKPFPEEGFDELSEISATFYNQKSWLKFSAVTHIFCYCVLIGMNLWLLVQTMNCRTQEKCLKEVRSYSPILDQATIVLEDRRINGTLLNTEDFEANPYLQSPSPEVDEAWEALTAPKYLHIRASDIKKMGKDPSVSVKLPEGWNYGHDAYVAELDILHKLHCLNLIRKDINFDYYYGERYPGKSFAGTSDGHRMHTNHCLYIILQTLMCDVNTDIVPYMWVDAQDEPYPDFSINRKCGNLDVLLDWRYGYRVTNERFDELKKPETQERIVELKPGANGVLGIAPANGV